MDYNTLRFLVWAVEENNQINDAKWSDWQDSTDITECYQPGKEPDQDVLKILDRAISTNGFSLLVDLRKAEFEEYGGNFPGLGNWIDIIEHRLREERKK
jgi:hypothetical protein